MLVHQIPDFVGDAVHIGLKLFLLETLGAELAKKNSSPVIDPHALFFHCEAEKGGGGDKYSHDAVALFGSQHGKTTCPSIRIVMTTKKKSSALWIVTTAGT